MCDIMQNLGFLIQCWTIALFATWITVKLCLTNGCKHAEYIVNLIMSKKLPK